MGNALRNQPFPSIFPELKTSPTYNSQSAVIYSYVFIITLSVFLILPGVRGLQRLWTLLRVCTAIWIAAVLLVCNFSTWYGATICTKTQFKAHTSVNEPQEITAEVGLHIGLRGINITLIEKNCGSFSKYESPFPDESIYYNEYFSWSNPWGQGRQDFGKYGGKFRQQYREALYRGIPYPIAWIAEYFTIDGEQIRWYRKFQLAGWYTHIIMWLAFATHISSILLFMKNVTIGAWQLALTGSLMLLACLSYSTIIINDPILQIHFPTETLIPTFKPTFWVNLGTGIATLLIATLILIAEKLIPLKMATFFSVQDYLFFEVDDIQQEETLGEQNSGHRLSLRRTIKRRTKRVSRKKSRKNETNKESCKINSGNCQEATHMHKQSTIETSIVDQEKCEPSEQVMQEQGDDSISVFISHEFDKEIQVGDCD